MSKTLSITRHGKSDWDYENLSDFDRPLKLRGYNDAYKMASHLKSTGTLPDVIYSSPANRALYTAIIFSRVFDNAFNQIQIKEDLYLASYRILLHQIKNCRNTFNHLIIFAHNPGVTDLVNHFIENPIYNLPTSGFVRLDFDVDNWKDIGPESQIGYIFDYPKKTGG